MTYWFMFPIAVVVATTAMASGVGGATFFAPILIIGLKLSPEVAIGVGLITEVFGFSSGLYAYIRKRLIDFRLGLLLASTSVPAAIVGTVLSGIVPGFILKAILGIGLLVIGITFLRAFFHSEKNDETELEDGMIRTLTSRKNETFSYRIVSLTFGRTLSGIGGLAVGLISTGLGELNGYYLLQRSRIPSPVAVATSVFVVALTAVTGAVGHAIGFFQSGGETLSLVGSIVMFTVPGVLIGAQIGPLLAEKISKHTLEKILGVLFTFIAVLTIVEAVAH